MMIIGLSVSRNHPKKFRREKPMVYTVDHYSGIIMSSMASQITSLKIVYSAVYSGADKKKKICVTGLCEGNSPVTAEFPAQKASNAENLSI